MVSPRDAMETVVRAVANSGELPRDMSVLQHEADADFEDADIDMPLLEVQLVEAENVVVSNTDFIDFVIDSNDNRIAKVYASDYEMTIQLDIWTSTNDPYTPDELGEQLREALYPYSSYGPDEPFLDEEQAPVDDITYFRLVRGERTDDLLQSPTVRKWSQEVELWGYEEFRTDRDYITTVDYPQDGELNDVDGNGVISNT